MHEKHRLRRSRDVGRLRRYGRSRRHRLAIMLYMPNEQAVSRFAFSANGRVGNAVRRNRAKRLLREAVRLQLASIRPGWDILFIARAETTTATLHATDAAVGQLLKGAGVLAGELTSRRQVVPPSRTPGETTS